MHGQHRFGCGRCP